MVVQRRLITYPIAQQYADRAIEKIARAAGKRLPRLWAGATCYTTGLPPKTGATLRGVTAD